MSTSSILEKLRKYDIFLVSILLIGLAVFIVELYFISKTNTLSALAVGYTNLADNLLKGKGFVLDYIDQYYVKFDSIPHPEEWGFPMMGILTAPFIALFGKTALAAKLPTLIIGTIFFPVLVYYLGREFFDKKVGFLAAVSVLFYVRTFDLILNGQRDMACAFFALAGIYFFYKGMNEDQAKYFYLMGIFLGVAYLTRQTALIIFPTLLLAYYLIKKRFELNLIYGLVLGVLVISPWLIKNYLIFGDPFFSANRYAVWIYGWFPDYDPYGYFVYWDRLKPSLFWLSTLNLTLPVHLLSIFKVIKGFAVQYDFILALTTTTFIGLVSTSKEKIKKPLLLTIAFVVIISIIAELVMPYFLSEHPFLVTFWAVPYLIILFVAIFILGKESPKNRLFAIIWGAFAVFHAVYAFPEVRFLLPLIPMFFIFIWAGFEQLLVKISASSKKFRPEHMKKVLALALIIFLIINIFIIYKTLPKWQQKDSEVKQKRIVELIKLSTETDAVIMICNAIIFHHYSGRKTIEMPSDTIERDSEVAKWYKPSYISFANCKQRTFDKSLFYAIFGKEEPPPNYREMIYRIELEEGIEGEYKTINFNPLLVAKIDENGKKIWTTDHLSEK
ncbi:TPA: glycosyltransferase family 39 protein [archaeon]|uniref:Glycosyltransferase family 39 protein n=1 Tax=Candidatus Naiadarchaeum limnaeum TaxID=2756139 RepID=A0A832V1F8_9ARCH|nr:glycosyltransferase family 39 protein [Candidatus Naiadarchaeum limnaeum]